MNFVAIYLKYISDKLDEPKTKYNITKDGSAVSAIPEESIDWEERSKDDTIFEKPFCLPEKNKRTDITIAEIKEIKKICVDNDIELNVIFNPVYIKTYLANDQANLEEFKYKLAQVTDFYDFATINSITKNRIYWKETSHFRKIVSDMIVDRVLQRKNADIPDDFGVLVTKENVAEHLKNSR